MAMNAPMFPTQREAVSAETSAIMQALNYSREVGKEQQVEAELETLNEWNFSSVMKGVGKGLAMLSVILRRRRLVALGEVRTEPNR